MTNTIPNAATRPATPAGFPRATLLAKMVIIEGESETAFHQLYESLERAFVPPVSDFDEYERNLLDTMALSAWRRMRAVGMETAAVTLQIKSNRDFAVDAGNQAPKLDPGTTTYQAFTALLSNSPAFELVLRYEARHARAYERAAKALRDYRKSTGRDLHDSDQTNPTPALKSESSATQTPSDRTPSDRTPSEPRAQASGPQLPTCAAAPLDPATTQHKNQPNEPEPPASAPSDTPKGRSARWHKRQARLARRKK